TTHQHFTCRATWTCDQRLNPVFSYRPESRAALGIFLDARLRKNALPESRRGSVLGQREPSMAQHVFGIPITSAGQQLEHLTAAVQQTNVPQIKRAAQHGFFEDALEHGSQIQRTQNRFADLSEDRYLLVVGFEHCRDFLTLHGITQLTNEHLHAVLSLDQLVLGSLLQCY